MFSTLEHKTRSMPSPLISSIASCRGMLALTRTGNFHLFLVFLFNHFVAGIPSTKAFPPTKTTSKSFTVCHRTDRRAYKCIHAEGRCQSMALWATIKWVAAYLDGYVHTYKNRLLVAHYNALHTLHDLLKALLSTMLGHSISEQKAEENTASRRSQ